LSSQATAELSCVFLHARSAEYRRPDTQMTIA
jgi:hypothetical protein